MVSRLLAKWTHGCIERKSHATRRQVCYPRHGPSQYLLLVSNLNSHLQVQPALENATFNFQAFPVTTLCLVA